MAELAQLTITVDSAAATRNIQKLVKSLQTATKPIQQVQKQLSFLDKTIKGMQVGFKGFGGIVKLLTSLLGGLFKGFSSVGKLLGGLVSKGFKSSFGDFEAEGLVATPKVPLRKRNGDRIITKLCCRDYH